MIVIWVILFFAVIISGCIFGARHHDEIQGLIGNTPKLHRHEYRRLRYETKTERQPKQPSKPRRPAVAVPIRLDQNDIDELDGMFGSAGENPGDYV